MQKIKINSSPKITVITPTYNRADLIVETIKSILNQEFTDFEYLILDDGSSDNTEEVVKPFLKDKRIKYLKHINQGEANTFNWGWELAKGEYFTNINSDDPILPGLFSEMVKFLDKKRNIVVAYPDFYFINDRGEIIKNDKNSDWNFLEALSSFSCYAASAGTFIRRTVFNDIKKLKNSEYKHISDIDMYWRMAIKGEFFHLPKFLATWRVHDKSISAERYKAIPEIQKWFEEYFSQKDLPAEVRECKGKVKDSIYRYCISLINQSGVENKIDLIVEFNDLFFKADILEIGDNDLVGNKFNGHDLQFYLNEKGISTKHLVWKKESSNAETFEIARDNFDREEIFNNTSLIQKQYEINGILNPLWYDVLYDPLFLNSKLVHFHLVHNGLIDLQLLPLMSRLKPIVWTLHDPWAFSEKYIENLDDSALSFEIKKTAIENSKIEVIVASKFMFNMFKEAAMFKDKNVHLIPFGINQSIFKKLDKLAIRKKFNIPADSLVISFRSDNRYKKGVDYVEYVIEHLETKRDIYFISFGGGIFYKNNEFKYIEYDWIKDDLLMADIYNVSDLFLMPSTLEAFGMMAIESMSCGVMPFVLDGTALPEVVNSSECGVSSPKNKNEYLKIVQYYVNNDKERKERADKCLKFAEINYNKDLYLNKIINVYNEAKEKHQITKEDQELIKQLKKHVSLELENELKHVLKIHIFVNKKTLKIINYTKTILLKCKKCIPPKLRTAIRKKFVSYSK